MCRLTLWTYKYVVLDAYVRESESGRGLAVRAPLVGLDASQLIQQLLSCTLTHNLLSLSLSFKYIYIELFFLSQSHVTTTTICCVEDG